MPRYRKVSTQIWNDKKFNSLSDDGQFVFIFLLTHPSMTSIGGMRHTIEGLASEKDWTFERLSKAFFEAEKIGIIRYDKKANCITLPNFIKHNKPENPNVVKSWGVASELVPECNIKDKQIQILMQYVVDRYEKKEYNKTYILALKKAFGRLSKELLKDFRIQEQEQEQEQEQYN